MLPARCRPLGIVRTHTDMPAFTALADPGGWNYYRASYHVDFNRSDDSAERRIDRRSCPSQQTSGRNAEDAQYCYESRNDHACMIIGQQDNNGEGDKSRGPPLTSSGQKDRASGRAC